VRALYAEDRRLDGADKPSWAMSGEDRRGEANPLKPPP